VRVLASTNQNLKERMLQGLFREDLFYRLNVVSIKLPPLRERQEDIPFLADHFLKKYKEEYDRQDLKPAPGFMEALHRNPWQGNVRELENTIKRAVIMSKAPVMTISDLSPDFEEECLFNNGINDLPYKEAKDRVVTRFTQEYMSNLLTRHQGNVTHAAKSCGLERQSLQQLLRRYGINAEIFRNKSS
jgi:DNA-binding NtrC family response regulator